MGVKLLDEVHDHEVDSSDEQYWYQPKNSGEEFKDLAEVSATAALDRSEHHSNTETNSYGHDKFENPGPMYHR